MRFDATGVSGDSTYSDGEVVAWDQVAQEGAAEPEPMLGLSDGEAWAVVGRDSGGATPRTTETRVGDGSHAVAAWSWWSDASTVAATVVSRSDT